MSRKMYMPERVIQQYEHMDESQLASVFFKEGLQRGGEYFVQLMRSYRIAANVAHSAWKLIEELQHTGQIRVETVDELKKRLHLFAPEAPAFGPPRPVLEYECRLLEELYDHLSTWNDQRFNTGILMEQLFKRIEEKRRQLAE